MRPVSPRAGSSLASLEAGLFRRHSCVVAGGVELKLETLDDLDAVIDQLVAVLPPSDPGGARLAATEMCPHFGVVWPSALALCEHMADTWTASPLEMLELGCGLGLPSMVARRLGTRRVLATDRHPLVPFFLSRNSALNKIEGIEYRNLDWRNPGRVETFDLIVGSDLLYEPWQPASLASFLTQALKPGGKALLADPGRKHLDAFVTLVEASGLSCTLEAVRPIFSGSSRVDVLIVSVRG